jgi:hypothetical protein
MDRLPIEIKDLILEMAGPFTMYLNGRLDLKLLLPSSSTSRSKVSSSASSRAESASKSTLQQQNESHSSTKLDRRIQSPMTKTINTVISSTTTQSFWTSFLEAVSYHTSDGCSSSCQRHDQQLEYYISLMDRFPNTLWTFDAWFGIHFHTRSGSGKTSHLSHTDCAGCDHFSLIRCKRLFGKLCDKFEWDAIMNPFKPLKSILATDHPSEPSAQNKHEHEADTHHHTIASGAFNTHHAANELCDRLVYAIETLESYASHPHLHGLRSLKHVLDDTRLCKSLVQIVICNEWMDDDDDDDDDQQVQEVDVEDEGNGGDGVGLSEFIARAAVAAEGGGGGGGGGGRDGGGMNEGLREVLDVLRGMSPLQRGVWGCYFGMERLVRKYESALRDGCPYLFESSGTIGCSRSLSSTLTSSCTIVQHHHHHHHHHHNHHHHNIKSPHRSIIHLAPPPPSSIPNHHHHHHRHQHHQQQHHQHHRLHRHPTNWHVKRPQGHGRPPKPSELDSCWLPTTVAAFQGGDFRFLKTLIGMGFRPCARVVVESES